MNNISNSTVHSWAWTAVCVNERERERKIKRLSPTAWRCQQSSMRWHWTSSRWRYQRHYCRCCALISQSSPTQVISFATNRLHRPRHPRCLKSQSQAEMNCRRRISTASNSIALLQRLGRKKAHKVNKNSHGIFYNDILRVVAPRLLSALLQRFVLNNKLLLAPRVWRQRGEQCSDCYLLHTTLRFRHANKYTL